MYKVLNVLGVLFAIWFALTSWAWLYYIALYISYPFGVISLLIYLYSPYSYAKSAIKVILCIGLAVSIVALLAYK